MVTPAHIAIALKDIVGIVVQHGPATATDTGRIEKRAPRRRVTGRNQQLNVKVTAAVAEQFYAMADELDVPLGALLERALAALAAESK